MSPTPITPPAGFPPDPKSRPPLPFLVAIVVGVVLIFITVVSDLSARYRWLPGATMGIFAVVVGLMWSITDIIRARPFRRQFHAQVLSRPDCTELWGTDPLRQRVAAAV